MAERRELRTWRATLGAIVLTLGLVVVSATAAPPVPAGGCGDAGAGDCFDNNGTPFCDDAKCCVLVCELDPFCCSDFWDGLCANAAEVACRECGDPEAGSCFVANGTPYCDDAECCTFICDIDPFCCTDSWDSICSGEADELCLDKSEFILDQPPNQTNGLFSDVDCQLCKGGPIQILAENFNVVTVEARIGAVRIFGGYFPGNLEPINNFTVNFHADDGGVPGVIIDSQTPSAAHTLTGAELFGVPEYQIDIEIVDLPLTPGTYWVSVYNDTSANSDSFFWEVGNLDSGNGKPGGAFRSDLPGPDGWFFDPAQELATTLLPADPCPADLNGDGVVSNGDIVQLLGAWGPCDKDCPEDLNGNGSVDNGDVVFLLGAWGDCPAQ